VGRVKLNFLKMKKSMFTAFAVGLCMTANVMAQVPSYVPTNGLVGWWPFNGNANDESGNGNNGTVNGATLMTDRFGNANKAYSFDGVNDNILTSRNALNSFSLSLWYFTSQNSAYTALIDAYNGNWEIYLKNLKPTFAKWIQLPSNYQEFISNNGSLSNQWNHIVCTYDSGVVKFYLNNVLISTFQNVTLTNNNNGSFYFGASISGTSQFFNGKLDDIGVWNRLITPQEISDLYNANICYDYVTVTDTLIINTGITGYNPITYLNTLKIWPNPSNDHITIDAGNLATMKGYNIKIEDAQGQQVFQDAVTQQQFYIDITTWGGNGLYFVRIIDPQGNTVDIKKIVLQ
jgi:hypothetical protein